MATNEQEPDPLRDPEPDAMWINDPRPVDPVAFQLWKFRHRIETTNRLLAILVVLALLWTGLGVWFLLRFPV